MPQLHEASHPNPANTSRSGFARHGYLFEPTRHSIRDAIYGSIPLTDAAYRTLDTRVFQRLKHIKQVGPVYLVYSGATHTRFSHSIGVYHLARLALQHLTSVADTEPEVGRAALAAALLHDIGHFPYSHVMDEILINGSRLSHADLSVHLVEHDDELRGVLQHDWDVDPALVGDLLAGRNNPRIPPWLHTLIDGPMDVDKLDYLNRDAHHTGVPYGKVEVQRLIDFLAVDSGSGDLVITETGVGTVESVIFAKYLMFRYVYYHHTARIAGAMMNRAVLDCLLALGISALNATDPRLQPLLQTTDAAMEAGLRAMLEAANKPAPPSLALLERINDRRLYKRAAVLSCNAAPVLDTRLRDALARRELEAGLAATVMAAAPASGSAASDYHVLIQVPPTAKFAVDVKGIQVEGDDGELRLLPWEATSGASYLSSATVAAMEQSIRTILFLYDNQQPDPEAARLAIAQAVSTLC